MTEADELRTKIEALAPDRNKDGASAVALSDACFALEAKFSQALGIAVPKELPERGELRERCLELVRMWVPQLDFENLQALEWRIKDRRMPIDVSSRKAELKDAAGKRLPDRTQQLAAYAKLPALEKFEPIDALYVEDRLMIGEWPETGVTVDAKSGAWLAYFRDREEEYDRDADEGPPSELLAVHADSFANVAALRGRLRRLPERLPIDGARMAVANARSLEDEDIIEAMSGNYRDDFYGHVAQVMLGGDGRGHASVAEEAGKVVLVVVEV